MRARTLRLDATAAVIALAALTFFALALMISVATVVGETRDAVVATVATSAAVDETGTSAPLDREADKRDGEDSAADAITMSIDLEEGAAIDVDLPESNVVIDTWRGDNVIVIVEKSPGVKRPPRETAGPMNIEVTRTGRDLRIASVVDKYAQCDLLDVNFTILVPERYAAMRTNANVKDTYSLGKLTSLLWRTVGKEFLKWVAF